MLFTLFTIDPPTRSQRLFINAIENELGVEFDGNTKYDASEFIDEYKEEYAYSSQGTDWVENDYYDYHYRDNYGDYDY